MDTRTDLCDVIFCGNPGVGKSTLLSSISSIQFRSGISFGEGLTYKLDFKSSPRMANFRFGDTPGLGDIKLAERAAQAITEGLTDSIRQKRNMLLFFVITLEGKIMCAVCKCCICLYVYMCVFVYVCVCVCVVWTLSPFRPS